GHSRAHVRDTSVGASRASPPRRAHRRDPARARLLPGRDRKAPHGRRCLIAVRDVPPRRRPLWLVGLLTVLSLGIYLPLWLGFTWAELRRETGDERMQPLAHALSVFIPGFGAWQVHRHFALINFGLERIGAKTRVDPLS